VDAQNGRHVVGGGQALTGTDVAIRNVPTDLRGNLVMEGHPVASIKLDIPHGDNHSVTIMSSTTTAPRETPEFVDHELVIREARRRQHRRLAWMGLGLTMVVAVAAIVAAASSATKASPHHAKVVLPSAPKSPRPLPTGSIVALKIAGPLAVGPTGSLYVAAESQHEILVRLADGEFSDVAGDGTAGFSGDGGLATKAELSSVSAMSFAPNGDLYLADGTRVRVVEPNGTIHTIAGDGRAGGPVANGAPALSASLGPVVAVTTSPGGRLFFATSTQIFRLSSAGTLQTVPAIATLYAGKTIAANELVSIAVDAHGTVFASAAFAGWSVYRVAPDGVATNLGYARRSGGQPAILQRSPEDTIEADSGPYLEHVEANRLVRTPGVLTSTSITSVNDLPGITQFIFMDYFAFAPDGTLYADNMPTSGFDPYQQIVSVTSGQGASLWRGAPGT